MRAGDSLDAWITAHWPDAQRHTEWSVQHRLDSGTIVRGIADLVLELDDEIIVVDHKSFPGARDAAIVKAASFAGQLAAYAEAIAAATGKPVTGRFIHLPIAGCVVSCVDQD